MTGWGGTSIQFDKLPEHDGWGGGTIQFDKLPEHDGGFLFQSLLLKQLTTMLPVFTSLEK